jgi:signal transduction histidine kinase/CheY-like chemotaxis protein/HPt (histidine-containing phosphotransfer) domain-containing protein
VHRARHKNGDWIWIEIALTFVGGASEAALGTIGALRDVSQRQRQAEALRQALDAAENASRIKTEFLANMSHELRTPLAGILGVHDILHADPALNERQRRLVKLAEQSGRMLLNVVNDILDYSKMEAGKLEVASVPFSTADLIGGSVAIIAGLAAAKHLDVQVASDESIAPYLIGDEDRLRQILLNLLNNAVKFTRSGHIALKVDHLGAAGGAEKIRFSVSDTGIGIPEDKIDRLFHRFSQVDGSTAREFGGTGLGLAIVKRLVDLMEGELGVESVVGEGSTFWFAVTLPIAKCESTPPGLSPVPPRPTRSARILVAEDIEVNQEIIRGMLESAGHKVHMVANGADAILAAASRRYEIVLMDVQMPVVDGVVATKGIRALPGPASRLPIIAMTANVLAPKVAHFLASGMDDHVGKPFSREELLAVVARHAPPIGASGSSAARDRGNADIGAHAGEAKAPAGRGAVLEAAKLDALANMLGAGKVDTLLGDLAARLEARLAHVDAGADDLAHLASEAHKLVSLSGMLGFAALSNRCAALEAALEAGEDRAAPLADVRRACVDALAEISRRLGPARPVAARA